MKEALRLARRGLGRTSPNPMVGAVVVKDGKIIGKGYHKKAGEPHAEILALGEPSPVGGYSLRSHSPTLSPVFLNPLPSRKELRSLNAAAKDAMGATLYVNLEPCCHWGKTPPCTQAIIGAGIKEVHVSIIDPSPWVNGKGIEQLREAGIKVILGECEEEALELNEAYLKWVKTGIPFVSLKAAITLDGKIADSNKGSKWITNELSRKFVHRLRSQVDAVMVGIGTVIADNPELTVRLVRGRNPKRIILDSDLRIPRGSKVLGDGCIIASLKDGEIEGAEVWEVRESNYRVKSPRLKRGRNRKVDILEVLRRAGKAGIQSVLIEGGKEVFTEALSLGVVDKVYFFIAPKLLGNGLQVVGDLGIKKMEKTLTLTSMRFKRFGDNVLLEGKLDRGAL